MKYEEQKLQMQCVAWFRAQYPQYAMLLTHPINEGGRNTAKTGGMHKAEGTQAGVPDLLLFMPSSDYNRDKCYWSAGLGIEMKTKTGSQSQEQKDFQKMFEAARYRYEVVKSFEQFKNLINNYLSNVVLPHRQVISSTYAEITKAAEQREREKFYKVIGKKDPKKV